MTDTNVDRDFETVQEMVMRLHLVAHLDSNDADQERDDALAALSRIRSAMEGERAPCKCHGSWPLHADDQAADLRALHTEVERLREALGRVTGLQPTARLYIEANGFKWEGEDSIGNQPGNWQHLAFSLYSDLCEADSIARQALQPIEGETP